MMMSMFSSFDALTAEFCGWKFPVPSISTTSNSVAVEGKTKDGTVHNIAAPETAAVVAEQKGPSSVKKVLDRDSSSSSLEKEKLKNGGAVRRQKDAKMTPRFAIELDGIHTFEMILPY